MVTLYDVARRAAVSTATVSRVVHGQDRVREATRIRVQQAIEELGYVPDGAGQSGEQVGDELLARHRAAMPDAVVCANDQMAIGVLRALTAAGVRVPGEVAVTGFDDLYPARLVDPPLSTVRQPMRMLGQRACARLLDRIAHPGLSPAVQLLPTELVLRSSCGCPPGTLTRQPVPALKPG